MTTRKNFLVQAYQSGSYLKNPEAVGQPPANPMSDPAGLDQMMNMVKGNMAMIVPQTLIMGWINAFFSGFVICQTRFSFITVSDYANVCSRAVKLPFPLTIRFKSMLQSGVNTRDLDVRWVSSLSW